MSIALKKNVRPNVLVNTCSLCFCTSLFVSNKYGIVKLSSGCWLQIEFINWISFVLRTLLKF
jgi:hypothetical protein